MHRAQTTVAHQVLAACAGLDVAYLFRLRRSDVLPALLAHHWAFRALAASSSLGRGSPCPGGLRSQVRPSDRVCRAGALAVACAAQTARAWGSSLALADGRPRPGPGCALRRKR